MDKILSLAGELGDTIAQSDRFRGLRAAEQAVEADPETRRLLEAFDAQRRKIADLEAQRKPVEPEDKHELQRLSDSVTMNPRLQSLLRCQADSLEMMNKVNQTIREKMSASLQQEPA